MTSQEKTLKLALEYVKLVQDDRYNAEHIDREALVTAIKEALAQPKSEYERGFIDGMQKQMQSSVDKAVNAMTQPTYYIPNKAERTWVGLTNDELTDLFYNTNLGQMSAVGQAIALLKERNS